MLNGVQYRGTDKLLNLEKLVTLRESDARKKRIEEIGVDFTKTNTKLAPMEVNTYVKGVINYPIPIFSLPFQSIVARKRAALSLHHSIVKQKNQTKK